MSSLPVDPRPLQLRQLIFMPWRWNRVWQGLIIAAVVLALPAYILSCPVIEFFYYALNVPSELELALEIYFLPAIYLYETVPLIEVVWDWEFSILESLSEAAGWP